MIDILKLVTVQRVIDYIEPHIQDELTPDLLADIAGYSPFHFNRIFEKQTGYTLMDYVVKRKLQYALYDLAQGKKVIEIALTYGFETHAGFTKAFKKCFGSPPRLYRQHCPSSLPQKIDLSRLEQNQVGGIVMQPKLVRRSPFTIAGKTVERSTRNISYTRDSPALWHQNLFPDESIERTLYETLTPETHGEYCLNLRSDELLDGFTYLFAVNYDMGTSVPDGWTIMTIPSSTYAIFRTPLVPVEDFASSIAGTWQYILDDWLPQSSYEVDETRYDFEYYDEHCHDWEYEKVYMEIHLPIKERKQGS